MSLEIFLIGIVIGNVIVIVMSGTFAKNETSSHQIFQYFVIKYDGFAEIRYIGRVLASFSAQLSNKHKTFLKDRVVNDAS